MKKIFIFFFLWVVVIYAFANISSNRAFFDYSYESTSIIKENLPQIRHLLNFDGGHYQNISRFGYIRKFQTAFFPLYPLVIKLISFIAQSYLISALLISLVCLYFSLILLKKLRFGTGFFEANLIFFPLSFFFLTGYTESLFLFLSLLTWHSFRQKKYLISGVFGFLSALSRFYGILLFPCLLLEHFLLKNQSKKALPLFLIPFGLVVYMIYLRFSYQDPFAFINALSLWNKSGVVFPLQTIYRYFKILTTVSPKILQYWIAALEFLSLIIGLLASYYFYRGKQFSYSLYLFLGSTIPAFTGTLQSLPRYLIVLFPIYFIKIPQKLRLPLYGLSLVLQLVLLKNFLAGRFIS